MKPTEAVAIAKAYLTEIFESEGISHLALEEIDYDHDEESWMITLGFLRSADRIQPLPAYLPPMKADRTGLPRVYRVVKVRDADGSVSSIKIRDLAA